MRDKHDSVYRKLTRALMGVSVAVLTITCVVFGSHEYLSFRKTVVVGLTTRGEIIAANSAAALAFQNEADARAVLSALRIDPHMEAACLYDQNGRVFARYPSDSSPSSVPRGPGADGSRFETGGVSVFLPVVQQGRRLGTVYLRSDLVAMTERFRLYGLLVVLVVAGSISAAFVLSVRLQRRIADPILDLSRTAQAVSRRKDYSLRARKSSDDEIGQLTDSFNEMLAQIEERDRALRKTKGEIEQFNAELEQRVGERTTQLEAANRLKSEFLANMSHELRTPLNAIIGFAELIHDARVGPVSVDQKEYLGDILASSNHLLQLINDILDLAKVESGKMEFRPEPIDLSRVVSEVRDILRSLASQKRISIQVAVDPELTGIVVDPGRLKQVLYNYLSNALKFSPDEGRVAVRIAAAQGNRFRLEVEDEGVGIKPEDLDRLFKEFQQLDSGTAKRHAGTGLGLALTKRIVESQGGRVGVSSVPGNGSIFFAELPRVAAATEPTEPSSPLGTARRAGAPLILIIEDERKERDWLARTLHEAGYDADFASTGSDALERCRHQLYDAITLDLLLPDMSGHALLNEIRETSPNRETPVVVVSVAADSGGAAGFLVHDILQKPVSAEELVASLARAGVSPRDPGPVLVVDDDPASLKLARSALGPFGFRVQCHADPAEALRAASADLPAVIVLDLLMPDMDGFEFLARFRATSAGRTVPVVVWTGKDLTSEERAKLRDFAQAVVPKVGGVSGLIAEIQSRISARRTNDPAEAPDGR